MKITADTVVSMNYRLTNDEGTLIDESAGEPLVYLHGHGGLIPGVESALDGHEAGASLNIVVSPEEGYGQYDPELDLAVPRDQFPPEAQEQLVPGVRFQAVHPSTNQPCMYTIHDVDEEMVKCSGNHELAGQTLHFSLEVLEVREATADEISHGHVHGAGGCGH